MHVKAYEKPNEDIVKKLNKRLDFDYRKDL